MESPDWEAVESTYRAGMIAHRKILPQNVPSYPGGYIEWNHGTNDKSISSAKRMVNAFGIQGLHVAPALKSRHTEGHAIDMNISWTGVLKLSTPVGKLFKLTLLHVQG